MYELMFYNEVKNFDKRIDAVTAAKEMTLSSDGHMTVNVSDGVETLSFRAGKLVAYTYETRRTESRMDRGPSDFVAPKVEDATNAEAPATSEAKE